MINSLRSVSFNQKKKKEKNLKEISQKGLSGHKGLKVNKSFPVACHFTPCPAATASEWIINSFETVELNWIAIERLDCRFLTFHDILFGLCRRMTANSKCCSCWVCYGASPSVCSTCLKSTTSIVTWPHVTSSSTPSSSAKSPISDSVAKSKAPQRVPTPPG